MFLRRTSVRYGGKGPENATFNASLVSSTILGLALVFVGIYQLNYNFNFLEFDDTAFACSNTVFSFLLFLYSFYTIKAKMVTEGILYLSTAISSVLVTVSNFYVDTNLIFTMALFSVNYLGCALIFRYRRQNVLSAICWFMFFYCLICAFYPDDYIALVGASLLLFGGALVFVSCSTMIGVEFDRISINRYNDVLVTDAEYPEFFENTVGSILLATITFLYVYAVFFNYEVSMAYYIITSIVSVITLVAAIYGIYHGVLGQTVLMFLLALSKIIFTIFGFMDLGSTTHIDLMLVLIFIPLMVSFHIRKQRTMVLLTLATAITTVAQTFTGYVFLVEGAMAVTNIMAVYHALTTWYHADTGERLRDNSLVSRILGGLRIHV